MSQHHHRKSRVRCPHCGIVRSVPRAEKQQWINRCQSPARKVWSRSADALPIRQDEHGEAIIRALDRALNDIERDAEETKKN